jgi:hypothetical protein
MNDEEDVASASVDVADNERRGMLLLWKLVSSTSPGSGCLPAARPGV